MNENLTTKAPRHKSFYLCVFVPLWLGMIGEVWNF